jgi:hypothetical protein
VTAGVVLLPADDLACQQDAERVLGELGGPAPTSSRRFRCASGVPWSGPVWHSPRGRPRRRFMDFMVVLLCLARVCCVVRVAPRTTGHRSNSSRRWRRMRRCERSGPLLQSSSSLQVRQIRLPMCALAKGSPHLRHWRSARSPFIHPALRRSPQSVVRKPRPLSRVRAAIADLERPRRSAIDEAGAPASHSSHSARSSFSIHTRRVRQQFGAVAVAFRPVHGHAAPVRMLHRRATDEPVGFARVGYSACRVHSMIHDRPMTII